MTGYVGTMLEKKFNFQQFALSCARAFGALVTIRDEAIDAPIPEKFEPSPYYVKAVAEAKAKLKRLSAMSDKEALAFGQKEKAASLKSLKESLKKSAAENAAMSAMLEEVRQWAPPSSEHKGLKDFMIEQLTTSMNSDWLEKEVAKSENRDPMQYFKAALASAERDVPYYEKQLEEEKQRVATRNQWVALLRDSLNAEAVTR